MKPVVVPTSDVNSEHGVLVAWFVDDGAKVEAGTPLAEIETSKAVLEVAAPEAGIVLRLADPLQEVPLSEPIAMLFETPADLAAYAREREARAAAAAETPPPVRASVKAVRRAQELGVDLAALRLDRLITVKDVEEAAGHGVDEGRFPRRWRPGRVCSASCSSAAGWGRPRCSTS